MEHMWMLRSLILLYKIYGKVKLFRFCRYLFETSLDYFVINKDRFYANWFSK